MSTEQSAPSTDLVDPKHVAAEMLRTGMRTIEVARVLKRSEQWVRNVSNSALMVTVQLQPEDRDIADAMRELTWEAIYQARETLQFGSPADRHQLVRAIVSRGMGLIGAEKTTRLDQLRAEMEQTFGKIRADEDDLDELDYDDDA